jgi:hypothetical protein
MLSINVDALDVLITSKIKDILSTMTTFGSVSIETSPPSVVIKTMKAKQAQIISVMQPPPVKPINDIKLTLHATFDITNAHIERVITLSNVPSLLRIMSR